MVILLECAIIVERSYRCYCTKNGTVNMFCHRIANLAKKKKKKRDINLGIGYISQDLCPDCSYISLDE